MTARLTGRHRNVLRAVAAGNVTWYMHGGTTRYRLWTSEFDSTPCTKDAAVLFRLNLVRTVLAAGQRYGRGHLELTRAGRMELLDPETEGNAELGVHARVCTLDGCKMACACWCHGVRHHTDGTLRPDADCHPAV